MKTFAEFIKALETDEALKAKVKNALEGAEVKTEEAKISLLTKLAAENGYNVSTEDFTKRQADGKELDEDELKLVTGASGAGDMCPEADSGAQPIPSWGWGCFFSPDKSCSLLDDIPCEFINEKPSSESAE